VARQSEVDVLQSRKERPFDIWESLWGPGAGRLCSEEVSRYEIIASSHG
jgi:hypothetical protein